jgi:hypothetical protein
MRIEQIETAKREGMPLQITTAGGEKFRVQNPEHLIIMPKYGAVFLITDDELVHVVPLLTMTSLTYLPKEETKP